MSDLELSDDFMFADDPLDEEDEPLSSSSSTHISPALDAAGGEPSYQSTQDAVAVTSNPQPVGASRFADIPQRSRWTTEKAEPGDAIYAASAPVDIINPRRWRNNSEQADDENSSPPPSSTFVPLHTMYRSEKEEDILGTSYGDYRPRLQYRRKMEFLKRVGLIATDAPPTPPSNSIHPTSATVHPIQPTVDGKARADPAPSN